MQQPSVSLSASSLSDWLNGKSVPTNAEAVKFLVVYLSELSARSDDHRDPMPVSAWMRLHAEARTQAAAGRTGPRGRTLQRATLPTGPRRELRDLIYELYLRAGAPTLNEIETRIKDFDDLPAAPKRDTIHRIIAGRLIPTLPDALTTAVALARIAGIDPTSTADHVRDLWTAATTTAATASPSRLGRPISRWDPHELEVHQAIAPLDGDGEAPLLPAYVSREHDTRLRQIVHEVEAGTNRIVVLVGGSSTGKTRACWEAIQLLSDHWRLWHPIDPSRPVAVAEGVRDISPYMVVWLNEAQFYLAPSDPDLGERVAAGLRSLLEEPGRGPVLILATMWPEHWLRLTTRPPTGALDPYPQARELLAASTTITVPDAFNSADLTTLHDATDPRLRYAATQAESGRITQYLAGVPDLLQRYQMAPPAARAIIDSAIDARRYGHPSAIPRALIEHAAPGYMPDLVWDELGDDWLDQALVYTAAPCHGMRGPLTRIRPRPGDDVAQPAYRLADYLDQVGRTARAGIFPPASFWTAVAETVTDRVILREFGRQAAMRGRYQRAAQLYAQAAGAGEVQALTDFAQLRELVDQAEAEQLYQRAADLGSADALRALARLREQTGDTVGAEALYRQATDRGDIEALRDLAQLRERSGDLDGAEAIAREASDHGDTWALRHLALLREQTGDLDAAKVLYRQAADRGDGEAAFALACVQEQLSDHSSAEALYQQAVDQGDIWALRYLAERRKWAGDLTGAEALYRQAADHGDSAAIEAVAWLRAQAGDQGGAEALLRQAVDRGEVSALMHLAQMRAQAGDLVGAEALYREAADHGETSALMQLAKLREQLGDSLAGERIRRFGLTEDGAPGTPLKLSVDELVRSDTTLSMPSVGSQSSGGRRDE